MNAELSAASTGPTGDGAPASTADEDILLRVENLFKYFPIKSGNPLLRTRDFVHAVDGVSLEIRKGETLRHHVRAGHLRRAGHQHLVGPADAPVAPRDPDDLPGPVRVAEPAAAGRVDHR